MAGHDDRHRVRAVRRRPPPARPPAPPPVAPRRDRKRSVRPESSAAPSTPVAGRRAAGVDGQRVEGIEPAAEVVPEASPRRPTDPRRPSEPRRVAPASRPAGRTGHPRTRRAQSALRARRRPARRPASRNGRTRSRRSRCRFACVVSGAPRDGTSGRGPRPSVSAPGKSGGYWSRPWIRMSTSRSTLAGVPLPAVDPADEVRRHAVDTHVDEVVHGNPLVAEVAQGADELRGDAVDPHVDQLVGRDPRVPERAEVAHELGAGPVDAQVDQRVRLELVVAELLQAADELRAGPWMRRFTSSSMGIRS